MLDFDLFHFYRFLLAVLMTSYALVRLVLFLARWRDLGADDPRGLGLLKRYVLVQILGIRLWRFAREGLVIGLLLALLITLITLHTA